MDRNNVHGVFYALNESHEIRYTFYFTNLMFKMAKGNVRPHKTHSSV